MQKIRADTVVPMLVCIVRVGKVLRLFSDCPTCRYHLYRVKVHIQQWPSMVVYVASNTFLADWSFVYITKDLYLVITLNLIFLLLHEIRRISCLKTFKSDNSREKLHFHRVQWGGHVI